MSIRDTQTSLIPLLWVSHELTRLFIKENVQPEGLSCSLPSALDPTLKAQPGCTNTLAVSTPHSKSDKRHHSSVESPPHGPEATTLGQSTGLSSGQVSSASATGQGQGGASPPPDPNPWQKRKPNEDVTSDLEKNSFRMGDAEIVEICKGLEKLKLIRQSKFKSRLADKNDVGDDPIKFPKAHVPRPREIDFSRMYAQHGVKCLIHITRQENALSILKDGNLVPSGKTNRPQKHGMGGGSKVYKNSVFLSPIISDTPYNELFLSAQGYNPDGTRYTNYDYVVLCYDIEILDRIPFYTGSKYGFPTPSTLYSWVASPNPLTRLEALREIVLSPQVSNNHLLAVWVHDDYYHQFLTLLQDNGIEKINGINIAELINKQAVPSLSQ